MGRVIRHHSKMGIYHCSILSNGKIDIFEETGDYLKFRSIIKECIELDHFQIYAYCIMTDHIHLLIHTDEADAGKICHRIQIRFVRWYNKKYKRQGHLFQGPFSCQPVNNQDYLRIAWRYVLRNPCKAGMAARPTDYRWSSARAYGGVEDGITDTEKIRTCFSDRKDMFSFLNEVGEDDETAIEMIGKKTFTDTEAIYLMKQISGCRSIAEFQQLSYGDKERYIGELSKNIKSTKQLCRITGLKRRSMDRITGKLAQSVPGSQCSAKLAQSVPGSQCSTIP